MNVYDHKDEGQFLTKIHQWVLDSAGDAQKLKAFLDNECKIKKFSLLRDSNYKYLSIFQKSPLKSVEVQSLNSHKF